MITKGTLGRPILFEYHRENRRGENIVDVGVVKDASVHDIDTARWLFGEEPKTVYARVGSVMGKNEDFATILLGFGDERTAFITTNWVTPSRVRQLSAVFEKAVVTLDFISQEIQVHEESGTRVPKHTVQEPLMLELKEYVAAIAEGRQPLVTGKDGLMVTRIARGRAGVEQDEQPDIRQRLSASAGVQGACREGRLPGRARPRASSSRSILCLTLGGLTNLAAPED